MFGRKNKEKDEVVETVKANEESTTYNGNVDIKTGSASESAITTDQEMEEIPTLGWKEFKSLRNSKYEEKSGQFDKAFVLRHKRTGMIVELKAMSSVQACGFIGWRPRQVELIKVKDITDEKEAQKRIDGAETEIKNAKENCPALK